MTAGEGKSRTLSRKGHFLRKAPKSALMYAVIEYQVILILEKHENTTAELLEVGYMQSGF